MKSIKLSIVVPVYNTEKYIGRCIESIISQTYADIELILVNDGSKDLSGEICERYAKCDSRITVIHQKNSGQNNARMKGIQAAKGELITFVDSDDWLDLDIYEKIFREMKSDTYDLVCCDYFKEESDSCKKQISVFECGVYLRDSIVKDIFPRMRWDFEKCCSGISSVLWNKIFRKNMLINIMENIDYRMTIMEDSAIVYPYILRSRQVLITHLCGYHYFEREDSVMHSFSIDSFEKIDIFRKYIFSEIRQISLDYSDISNEAIKLLEKQFQQVIMKVIDKVIKDVYLFDVGRIRWCPPYNKMPVNSRIALYGAGEVGRSYYLKMYGDPNYKITIWVDKTLKGIENVKSPTTLSEADFDIVLIAVNNEKVALQIKDYLLSIAVEEEKIVWDKPQNINFVLF